MNKNKLRDVDIFERTLCCHPMHKLEEEEIEIIECETEELDEEEVFIAEEEKFDMKLLMEELECMKRRIQILQLHLKVKTDECPEENRCMDYEVLLNCSKDKEICALQKNQLMLQCQIKELIQCYKVSKDQIQDLQKLHCEQNKETMQLRETVTTLMEWKNTLAHEFGKCLERFEYLKHVKAEWRDVSDKMDEQSKCLSALKDLFVSKTCFQQEKKSLMSAINELKQVRVDKK